MAYNNYQQQQQYGGGPSQQHVPAGYNPYNAYQGNQQAAPPPMNADPQYLQNIFSRVDKDRSGSITGTELQTALSNGTWQPFNPETCRLMIGMFDSNGDGAISFGEFQALWRYINDWTQCFRGFDRDNSGNIDRSELTQALTQFGYRLSPPFFELLIKKFDRTNTGRIVFDDFVQLCVVLQTLTASFRDKDTDRDGIIQVGYEEFLTMVFSLKMWGKDR